MEIKTIVFEANEKKTALTKFHDQILLQSIIEDKGNDYCHTTTVANYTVTNEAVTASIIFAKIYGYTGTIGDVVDIRNMIALLTQG